MGKFPVKNQLNEGFLHLNLTFFFSTEFAFLKLVMRPIKKSNTIPAQSLFQYKNVKVHLHYLSSVILIAQPKTFSTWLIS